MNTNFENYLSNPFQSINYPNPNLTPTQNPQFPSKKTKRILKREAAKTRAKASKKVFSKDPLDDTMEESINDEDRESLSEKDKKKLQQKIRNRVSAQQSRDRKKIYIDCLQQQNSGLVEENLLLKEEILYLKQENQNLSQENGYLRAQMQLDPSRQEEIPFIGPEPLESLDSEAQNYLNEETTHNSSFSSPFQRSNVFKYGMALLSIISMVMIFGLNEKETAISEVFKTTGTWLMPVEENKLIQLSDYPYLKELGVYRREIMNKILFIEPIIEKEKKNKTKAIQSKTTKFLEEKNKNQLVVFSEGLEHPLSTFFCPSTYIYQSPVLILLIEVT